MKKIIALLLAAVMCVSLVGCSEEAISTGTVNDYMSPVVEGENWLFDIELAGVDKRLETKSLEIVQHMSGGSLETITFSRQQLIYFGIGEIAPEETCVWQAQYPVSEDIEKIEFHFAFSKGVGRTITQSFYFNVKSGEEQGDNNVAETVEVVTDENIAEDVDNNQTYVAENEPDSDNNRDIIEYLVPKTIASDWQFVINLQNNWDESMTLVSLEILHLNDGEALSTPIVFEGANLANLGLENTTLMPNESRVWEDWHPVVADFNEARYICTFETASGELITESFYFEMDSDDVNNVITNFETPDYSEDNGRDLQTLRYDAKFEMEVADGIWWVPARALGDSRYTNAEIHERLTLSPEQKATEISTLYEALQLYQVGGFFASDDNVRIEENGIAWEHHKPGYDAVRTNTGCCATDSNWLRYILDDDYDEVGYIATSQRDGSGHIYNYIMCDGFYYFIDLTHYRTDWVSTALESGSLDDYYNSDFILGNIHKAESVQAFVDYVQMNFNDPPGMMFKYTAENCLAIDGARSDTGVMILYEDVPEVDVETIFDDRGDSLDMKFVTSPSKYPDWSKLEDYVFQQ